MIHTVIGDNCEWPIMLPNSCSCAQIRKRRPSGIIEPHDDLNILAPWDTCPWLVLRGVTSIKATCQIAYALGCLDVHTYTLYRLVVFWVSFHLVSFAPPLFLLCTCIFSIIVDNVLAFSGHC